MKCDICGKMVYYFQHQMSTEDDIVKAVWHKDCASSVEEWEKKLYEILSKPVKVDYDPEKLRKRF